MRLISEHLAPSKLAMFAAAVLVGASIPTAVSGSGVSVPAIGTVPAIAVGTVGIVAGLGLYTGVKRYSTSGCGCGGDCNC